MTFYIKPLLFLGSFFCLVSCKSQTVISSIVHENQPIVSDTAFVNLKDYSKDFVRQESERRCLEEFKRVLPDVIIDNSLDDPDKAFSQILTRIQ